MASIREDLPAPVGPVMANRSRPVKSSSSLSRKEVKQVGVDQNSVPDLFRRASARECAHEPMPIPKLDEHGHLPPGVHDASLAEVRERFGRFQGSDHRVRLQERLEALVAEARGTGLISSLILNGSFTTGAPEPGDIDLILILSEALDLTVDLRPDQYNVLSGRRVKARHGFDAFSATSDPGALQPLIDFFSAVKGQPGLMKGMVRVAI